MQHAQNHGDVALAHRIQALHRNFVVDGQRSIHEDADADAGDV